jgi:hypothetical protein
MYHRLLGFAFDVTHNTLVTCVYHFSEGMIHFRVISVCLVSLSLPLSFFLPWSCFFVLVVVLFLVSLSLSLSCFFVFVFAYTATQVECEVDVEENGKSFAYRVVGTHVKSLSTASLDAFHQKTVSEEPSDLLTALEVCLKSHLIDSGRFFDADRRFFAYPNKTTVHAVDLQGGMELWMGFTQSIKLTERRCMLNL